MNNGFIRKLNVFCVILREKTAVTRIISNLYIIKNWLFPQLMEMISILQRDKVPYVQRCVYPSPPLHSSVEPYSQRFFFISGTLKTLVFALPSGH